MLCCFPTGISDYASLQQIKLNRILKILALIQLFLGIFTLFVAIWSAIMMLLGAMLLYLITWTKNWCTCVFYIILALLDTWNTILVVGNYFTDESELDTQGVLVIVSLVKLPFYLVSIYYAFLAYRELKGLFVENLQSGGLPQFYGAMQPERQPPQAPPQEPRGPRPFEGPGYRLG
mmetsp:Transcript_4563/g.6881  ORF Transcript_4563/g.6881 Transcript_4563/m.6881 type:complete len:176 (-) Transcript_4563:34-561(-)